MTAKSSVESQIKLSRRFFFFVVENFFFVCYLLALCLDTSFWSCRLRLCASRMDAPPCIGISYFICENSLLCTWILTELFFTFSILFYVVFLDIKCEVSQPFWLQNNFVSLMFFEFFFWKKPLIIQVEESCRRVKTFEIEFDYAYINKIVWED